MERNINDFLGNSLGLFTLKYTLYKQKLMNRRFIYKNQSTNFAT